MPDRNSDPGVPEPNRSAANLPDWVVLDEVIPPGLRQTAGQFSDVIRAALETMLPVAFEAREVLDAISRTLTALSDEAEVRGAPLVDCQERALWSLSGHDALRTALSSMSNCFDPEAWIEREVGR